MAFPNEVFLQPGDQYKVRTSTQGPLYLPGTLGVGPTGDLFRYCQMGAVAGVVGKLYQAPIPVPNHVLQTAAAAAVSATTIALTLGATAAAANDYINGLVVVDLASNTGFGYGYTIDAHPAVLSGGVFTIPLAGSPTRTVQSDGLAVQGNESVQVAIATTANSVSLVPNPWKKVILATTTFTAQAAGVAVVPIAASGWGWLKTRGEAMCLTDTTVVIGQQVMLSANAAGAVQPLILTEGTPNVFISPIVGIVTRVATTTNYSTIRFRID